MSTMSLTRVSNSNPCIRDHSSSRSELRIIDILEPVQTWSQKDSHFTPICVMIEEVFNDPSNSIPCTL